uniref:Cyclin-T2-like n=1 Tax=Saccoglossus kowalevskii TaxID=10224 RepID=A0ABM0MVI0_SACKO
FNVAIEHPHTYVVKCTQLIRASKDLAQTAYFMATNSLHLTTFCLQYKPTCIACVCIHLACKWSSWEIPLSSDGKHWWEYVDSAVNKTLLNELTSEFVQIMDRCPSRLKRKIHITNIKGGQRKLKGGEPSSDESSPGMPSSGPKIQPSTSKQNTELTNHDRQGKIEVDFKPKPESQMTYKDYKAMKEMTLALGKVKNESNTANAERKEHRHKQSEHSHRMHVEKKSASEVRQHNRDLKHTEQRPVKIPEPHKSGGDQRLHIYHKPPVEHHTHISGEQHRLQSSDHSHHKPSSTEQHRPSSSQSKPPSDHHRSSSSERRSHAEYHKLHGSDRKSVPPEAMREKHHSSEHRSHHKQYTAEATPNGTKLKIKVPPPQGKSEKHPTSVDAQHHAALKERERHKHHHHHHQKHHSSSEKHAAAQSLKHVEKHRPSSSSGKRPHSPDGKLRGSHSFPTSDLWIALHRQRKR